MLEPFCGCYSNLSGLLPCPVTRAMKHYASFHFKFKNTTDEGADYKINTLRFDSLYNTSATQVVH